MAKVKITGLPTSQGNRKLKEKKDKKASTPTLTGVPRSEANVEVEKGEVVLGTDPNTNQKRTANVGGKKHYEGGTPEKLPDGSAVYSDHLKLEDPSLLQALGFNGKTPKTFAQIAKKWDTSKLLEEREKEGIDQIKKRSLDKSLENANYKLSLNFILQQFHKKKTGEPVKPSKHFEPFLQRTGMSYEELMDAQGEATNISDKPAETPSAKMGYELPTYQDAGEVEDNPFGNITLYNESKTDAGGTTPTGKGNYYEFYGTSKDEYVPMWASKLDASGFESNEDFQSKIYDYSLKNNPNSIKNMWMMYGLTEKGMQDKELRSLAKGQQPGTFRNIDLTPENLKKLKQAFVDGKVGVRQMDPDAPELPEGTQIIMKADAPAAEGKHQWNLRGMDDSEAPVNMDYRWENKRALAQARKNKRNIPYLRPLTVNPDVFYTDQAYYNPDEAINAIQSQSAKMQEQRGMFAGPQQQLANQMAGQSQELMARVIGQYADKNVNAYNQERNFNTQVANRNAGMLASQAQSHHDKTTTLKQAFANAYRNADNEVANQEIAMHTERANRKNLEASIGEQYVIDPDTGMHVFVKGKDFGPEGGNENTADDLYAQIKRKHPGMSDDLAYKFAVGQVQGKYELLEGGEIISKKRKLK